MAFHNIVLPEPYATGYSAGPGFATLIPETTTGHEQRVAQRTQPRRILRPEYKLRSSTYTAGLIDFYCGRRGALYAFRARDILDFTTAADHVSAPTNADHVLTTIDGGTADGVATQFQLLKVYEPSGPMPLSYKIRYPEAASVVVAKNGVNVTSGGNWTVNDVTGVITFSVAPAFGDIITAGCNYHVPVRFGKQIDALLAPIVVAYQAKDLLNLELVEVLDEGEWPDIVPTGGFEDVTMTADMQIDPSRSVSFRFNPGASAYSVYLPPVAGFPRGGCIFQDLIVKVGAAGTVTFRDEDGTAVTAALAAGSWKRAVLSNDAVTAFWLIG